MSWFKIMRHDLHCGLLRWRYLAAVILAMIPCLEFQYALTARELSGNWIDFLLNTFRGVAPIQNTVAMNEVQIPFVWLTIMGACLYLNLDYMLYDLTTNGQQVIIRSGTRSGWFLSKCLWNLFATVCYFGLIALAECMFVVAIGGELTAKNTPEVSQMLFGMVTFAGFVDGIGRCSDWAGTPLLVGCGAEYAANGAVSVGEACGQLSGLCGAAGAVDLLELSF